LGERKDSGEVKTPQYSENHLFASPVRDVLNSNVDNSPSSYEASLIWNSHNSLFWNWRRVHEYFRDLFEPDNTKQVYRLMVS
jgi:hypothetical protein